MAERDRRRGVLAARAAGEGPRRLATGIDGKRESTAAAATHRHGSAQRSGEAAAAWPRRPAKVNHAQSDERRLRREIIATALEMNRLDINRGKAGNVSARRGEGFLITPSGLPYAETTPGDLVFMTLEGEARGERTPSSEWRFHRDLYRSREDIGAIVHTHPPFATALACHGRGIPAFHYMVAIAGGRDIRCAPYATYGTQELSTHALEAMAGRNACLLAHHGMITVGATLKSALALSVEAETLAEMYWRALQLGEPPLLADDEMDRVVARFADYGL